MGEKDCGITTDAGYIQNLTMPKEEASEYSMPLNILQNDRTAF
jgi:hypothetical protein